MKDSFDTHNSIWYESQPSDEADNNETATPSPLPPQQLPTRSPTMTTTRVSSTPNIGVAVPPLSPSPSSPTPPVIASRRAKQNSSMQPPPPPLEPSSSSSSVGKDQSSISLPESFVRRDRDVNAMLDAELANLESV